jgi:two-component sensor histidine kinase
MGLWIEWAEEGGPPVESPRREGFGSQLIAMLIGASQHDGTAHEFRPEGVRCRVGLPKG